MITQNMVITTLINGKIKVVYQQQFPTARFLKLWIKKTINENVNNEEIKFVVDKNQFQLYIGNILVASTVFVIEQSGPLYNENYVELHQVHTVQDFRRKGLMTYLLTHIFDYVKTKLKINNILLRVFKNNRKTVEKILIKFKTNEKNNNQRKSNEKND